MHGYFLEDYDRIIGELFQRFPSFQKVGAGAYKPGIDNMMAMDALLGHPHGRYPVIHVAGTNGKGSVSSMLSSVLAAAGLRTGLYTSPHIHDFRERMRIISGKDSMAGNDGIVSADRDVANSVSGKEIKDVGKGNEVDVCGRGDCAVQYISKEEVLNFICKWGNEMDRLDLSFFEITTAMAFDWFAAQNVDVAVIEAGLGGRLDSTNIVTPVLSVVTNIGYDHCDMLGNTLARIAGEKAGIFKRGVPAVVGESHPETDPVFEGKSLDVNRNYISISPSIKESSVDSSEDVDDGLENKSSAVSGNHLLTLADKTEPHLWDRRDEILSAMDLQGRFQNKNLRTVLAAADILRGLAFAEFADDCEKYGEKSIPKSHSKELCGVTGESENKIGARKSKSELLRRIAEIGDNAIIEGIEHTAQRTDFHGRWEKLSDRPFIIADIGHNSHALKYNFAQLQECMRSGRFDKLIIIFGAMADKDIDEIMKLFPHDAECHFVTVNNKRAMSAETLMSQCIAAGVPRGHIHCSTLSAAIEMATKCVDSLIYIGGSAYLVSEALPILSR